MNDSTLIKINDQNSSKPKIDRAFSPIEDMHGGNEQESGGEDSPNFKEAKNVTTTINYPDQSRDLNVFAMGESASGVFGPGQPYNDNSKHFMMKPQDKTKAVDNKEKYKVRNLSIGSNQKYTGHYRFQSSEYVIGTPGSRGQILML